MKRDRRRLRDEPGRGGRTWVRSNLRLKQAGIIHHGDRPHRDMHAMNAMLLGARRERAGDNDTIVCVGDVTLREPSAQILSKRSTMPGRKLPVAGNHDVLPGQERPETHGPTPRRRRWSASPDRPCCSRTSRSRPCRRIA